MRLCLVRTAPLLFLAVAAGVHGQAAPARVSDFDRFMFYNDCRPVNFRVEPLGEAADDLGITDKQIRDLVEVRLRSARLYSAQAAAAPLLYVYINVLEPLEYLTDDVGRKVRIEPHQGIRSSSFSVEVSFAKLVEDPTTGQRFPAWTWTTSALGRGYENTMRSAVSDHLDKFILSYLRVNERACVRDRER